MSNRIIRLGGSNIGDIQSIQNLAGFLNREEGKKFVVVSAIPELLKFVRANIENVFVQELNEKAAIK